MALELVLASKRLLDNDIPQGNTGLPRIWDVPEHAHPRSSYNWSV